jgi:SM-20-related protein
VGLDGKKGDETSPGLRALHADLRGNGIAVRERFLTPRQVRALVRCARARQERGDFVPARIGANRRALRRGEIRGDSICWLAEPLFPPERRLFGALEQLRLVLNREALLGLFELEMHYAWYPPGTGYARHVDQPQGSDQRRVSLVLYLNQRWSARDGGELKIVDDAGHTRKVEPVAGRLVAFLSAGREHEVLPTRRARLSLTGWFRGRA